MCSLLEDLDEDLMLELDSTVRQNQLALQPISRSGRVEAELLEKHPHLAALIEFNKQTKIDRISFQSQHNVLAKSFPSQAAFADDDERPRKSPLLQTTAPKTSHGHASEEQSHQMNSKRSMTDLMFDMEISEETAVERPWHSMSRRSAEESPTISARQREPALGSDSPWLGAKGKEIETNISTSTSPFGLGEASLQSTSPLRLPSTQIRETNAPKVWGSLASRSQKLDMKDIMAQASVTRVSNISAGLSAPTPQIAPISYSTPTKMTQRERKKQQQEAALLQQAQEIPPPQTIDPQNESLPQASPWQIASRGTRTSLKDILDTENKTSSASRSIPDRATSNPALTLRQTIPGKAPAAKRTTSEGSSSNPPLPPQRSISTPTG
ncbi:MAG: hypothetical protein Q9228_004069, partial [Teloschistes exilis]